jgi:hypothetical protein
MDKKKIGRSSMENMGCCHTKKIVSIQGKMGRREI